MDATMWKSQKKSLLLEEKKYRGLALVTHALMNRAPVSHAPNVAPVSHAPNVLPLSRVPEKNHMSHIVEKILEEKKINWAQLHANIKGFLSKKKDIIAPVLDANKVSSEIIKLLNLVRAVYEDNSSLLMLPEAMKYIGTYNKYFNKIKLLFNDPSLNLQHFLLKLSYIFHKDQIFHAFIKFCVVKIVQMHPQIQAAKLYWGIASTVFNVLSTLDKTQTLNKVNIKAEFEKYCLEKIKEIMHRVNQFSEEMTTTPSRSSAREDFEMLFDDLVNKFLSEFNSMMLWIEEKEEAVPQSATNILNELKSMEKHGDDLENSESAAILAIMSFSISYHDVFDELDKHHRLSSFSFSPLSN